MSDDPWTEDPVAQAEADIAAGKPAAAVARLGALLAAGRGGLLARLTLGRALAAAGDRAGAFETLHETAQLAPGLPEVAVALGEVLLSGGQAPVAIAEFQRALRLSPAHPGARRGLAASWLAVGEPAKAIEALRPLDPEEPDVAPLLAEAEAQRRLARSTPGFVRHLFDQFSTDYDARMTGALAYAAPQILLELHGLLGGGTGPFDVLDLGCGTGLAGVAFAALARRLVGVDLSPAMLAQAAERKLYTTLHQADIEAFLAACDARFDRVLAADVLVYLGDLGPVLAGVARVLRPGGRFLFTVEAHPGPGFVCSDTRRWRHGEAYLREAVAAARLDLMGFLACTPRINAGQPVPGYAVCLAAS